MVPLRSATTLLGTPALISDCAPMMLRVRPAQLTTTSVSGEGAMSRTRSTSSAPGTLVAVGIETRRYSSNGRLSSTTMSARLSISRLQLLGADVRRVAGVLDEFAERLARHIHAGEQLEAGGRPGRDAAFEIGRGSNSRRARGCRPRAAPARRRRRTARCASRGAGPAAQSAAPAGSAAPSAPTTDGSASRSALRARRSAPAPRRRRAWL